MIRTAYKLVDRAEWETARSTGHYLGSTVDLADGFVHMSTAEQLAETARRHYAGRTDLILATVDVEALGDAVVWEPSRGGALFPHIHGPLPFEAVVAERPMTVSASGEPRFEDGGAGWP